MSRSNSSSRRRIFYFVTAILLCGFAAGFAWFAALMPVGITGAVGYDLSRYGFALTALAVLVSLFFRPFREYGLVVFIVGLVLGIIGWPIFVPIRFRPGGQLFVDMILFGLPLGITVVSSLGFFLACRRNDRRAGLPGQRQGPAAAPRRFGMGTLMFVVLAASVFFAIARRLDMPPTLSLWAGSFLTIIGGLQMLMNRVPRAASVGTGVVLLPLTVAVTWTAIGANLNPRLAMMTATPADVAFAVAHLAIVGALLGYIGGVLVAGLFLVIEVAGRSLRPSRVASPPA